ncbi:MAG: helix-turn-helix domain-containing protein [Aquirufa sp.]|jgi:AraC family transcriptional activator of pobA
MEKIENLADFYKSKFNWVPEDLTKDWGHFNVFQLDPFLGNTPKPVPYRRRDFYKITLVKGNGKINYANKVIEVKENAIVFSNPFIPYKWESLEQLSTGYFCIFNDQFFQGYGNFSSYSLYQPDGSPVIELNDAGYLQFQLIFERMLGEINSEYIHKYDMLRNLALEMMHTALKLEPANSSRYAPGNANQKISMLFLELLERQFPIEGAHNKIKLKSPFEFANQLAVHVNHLNRAVKETTGKTTSQLIAERISQEAKLILSHGEWGIAEITDALGFNEISYFNHFFKKHVGVSPVKYKNNMLHGKAKIRE